MARKIIVYGHGDKSALGFPTSAALVRYLEGGIFQDEDGRYRYSQTKPASWSYSLATARLTAISRPMTLLLRLLRIARHILLSRRSISSGSPCDMPTP
jgi:hypothetical protein